MKFCSDKAQLRVCAHQVDEDSKRWIDMALQDAQIRECHQTVNVIYVTSDN